jgi:hypothetical protein
MLHSGTDLLDVDSMIANMLPEVVHLDSKVFGPAHS